MGAAPRRWRDPPCPRPPLPPRDLQRSFLPSVSGRKIQEKKSAGDEKQRKDKPRNKFHLVDCSGLRAQPKAVPERLPGLWMCGCAQENGFQLSIPISVFPGSLCTQGWIGADPAPAVPGEAVAQGRAARRARGARLGTLGRDFGEKLEEFLRGEVLTSLLGLRD